MNENCDKEFDPYVENKETESEGTGNFFTLKVAVGLFFAAILFFIVAKMW